MIVLRFVDTRLATYIFSRVRHSWVRVSMYYDIYHSGCTMRSSEYIDVKYDSLNEAYKYWATSRHLSGLKLTHIFSESCIGRVECIYLDHKCRFFKRGLNSYSSILCIDPFHSSHGEADVDVVLFEIFWFDISSNAYIKTLAESRPWLELKRWCRFSNDMIRFIFMWMLLDKSESLWTMQRGMGSNHREVTTPYGLRT